jgi:hypothetical protein
MQPIDDYLERSLWMDEQEFCGAIPAGVLLVEPDVPSADPSQVQGAPTKFDVKEVTDDVPRWARGARTPGNEVYFVLPLVKRPGLPYPDRMLIGRTDQNDLIIPHQTVSRAHAMITLGDPPQLVDTGSKHGTFVHQVRLAINLPCPLPSGRRVRFGTVRTMFLTAIRFHQYCQARTIADHAQRTIDGAIAYKP